MSYSHDSYIKRRDLWYQTTRSRISEAVDANGVGVLPQFNSPYREPVWILPALYTGDAESIALANRMVERYLDPTPRDEPGEGPAGKKFNIFQSNAFAHCLHRFDALLTPKAREVMTWHTEQAVKTYAGAGQPDFKFHGANDNMPMMAAKGLICGGEALKDDAAFQHGIWQINQFRRLLSRSAWASEFNSSTYSAVTISAVAKIATYSHDAAVRDIARQIEERMWTELLLHYHPSTKHQAGPQSRAYAIDAAGHNHAVQLLMWAAFGSEVTGRDVIKSYFEPNDGEVIHFGGNQWQSIAEFSEMLDTDLHIPEEIAALVTDRSYPARLRGRSECIARYEGFAAEYHTETYMEDAFSLGTVNGPLVGGEQTESLYVTYKRKPVVETFRDASTVFPKYFTSDIEVGAHETSDDGDCHSEQFQASKAWMYAIQKDNTGLLLTTPNLRGGAITTDTLKLTVLFPAHFGSITRSVIGSGAVVDGAQGESQDVVPVTVEAGEVFIHMQPLLPTNYARRVAVRFRKSHDYEVLEFVNYEGDVREFSRKELAMVVNGVVMTVVDKNTCSSLVEFHKAMSNVVITDYLFADHRFFLYQRADVEFDIALTMDPFGVQAEAIDGRHAPRPIFESSQVDVSKLPFMTGPVARNINVFPWGDTMETTSFPTSWLIGSRGLPDEPSYTNRVQDLKIS
ncbi:MAG TPA: hypothetical protein VGK19_15025 [Capsulimonadaceae bacterium]|jgi:hypothetical protein